VGDVGVDVREIVAAVEWVGGLVVLHRGGAWFAAGSRKPAALAASKS
jgi:hypothetical protein